MYGPLNMSVALCPIASLGRAFLGPSPMIHQHYGFVWILGKRKKRKGQLKKFPYHCLVWGKVLCKVYFSSTISFHFLSYSFSFPFLPITSQRSQRVSLNLMEMKGNFKKIPLMLFYFILFDQLLLCYLVWGGFVHSKFFLLFALYIYEHPAEFF